MRAKTLHLPELAFGFAVPQGWRWNDLPSAVENDPVTKKENKSVETIYSKLSWRTDSRNSREDN